MLSKTEISSMRVRSGCRWCALVLTVAVAAFSPVRVAWAAAPGARHAKSPQQTADDAKAEYDRGAFAEAALHYQAAFSAIPARTDWQYSAARALQKAGSLEMAQEWYEKFLANPGDAANLAEKAVGHLAEVKSDQLTVLLREAENAPDPEIGYAAARMATALAPTDSHAWMVAGVLAERANRLSDARACFRTAFLRALPGAIEERRRALERINALYSTPVEQPSLTPSADRRVVVTESSGSAATLPAPASTGGARKHDEPGVRWGAPLLLATGGIETIVGATVLGLAMADQTRLAAATSGYRGVGPIPMSYNDARAQAADIANRKTVASVVLGVGVAGAVGGLLWLIWRPAAADVPVSVDWHDGVQLALRGAW